FRRMVGIILAPAGVDPYIAATTPARFLQALLERRESVLTFRTVRSPVHKHADAPHPLCLLRPCRHRPRGRRAAEQRDEFASFPLTEMHPIPHGPGEIAGYRKRNPPDRRAAGKPQDAPGGPGARVGARKPGKCTHVLLIARR